MCKQIRLLIVFVLCYSGMRLFGEAYRHLSTEITAKGAEIHTIIDVRFDTISPEIFIIDETWPKGTQLLWCTWNGVEIECNSLETEYRWILGWEEHPAGNGVLNYAIMLPKDTSALTSQITGVVEYYEGKDLIGGDNYLKFDDDAPETAVMKVPLTPGWNLLSLPFELSDFNLQTLRCLGGSPFLANTKSGYPMQKGDITQLKPGTPFWLYNPVDSHYTSLDLTVDETEWDFSGEILPAGGNWLNGWNLVGVTGLESLQPLSSAHTIWKWDTRTFAPHSGRLEPGRGYLIFHNN